jgi:hypothetical protein
VKRKGKENPTPTPNTSEAHPNPNDSQFPLSIICRAHFSIVVVPKINNKLVRYKKKKRRVPGAQATRDASAPFPIIRRPYMCPSSAVVPKPNLKNIN